MSVMVNLLYDTNLVNVGNFPGHESCPVANIDIYLHSGGIGEVPGQVVEFGEKLQPCLVT